MEVKEQLRGTIKKNLQNVIDSMSNVQSVGSECNYPRQQVVYGAPGTGKSNKLRARVEKELLAPKANVFRTTFHPDSDYSTFVGAYKPMMKGDTIIYGYTPQAFMKAYTRAYTTTENVYLIIEEINRGNCAQIFGDIFQLLDRDENGYSSYGIKADDDIIDYIKSIPNIREDAFEDDEMRLPPNLYIWATMNTSDQSLFPIDSAFKRRWDWEYVPIQYNNSDWLIPVGDKNYRWSDFQKAINDKVFHIDHLEDKMMGDWFVVADKDKRVSKHTLINKVLFYLWNDVCKDGEGDIFKMTLSDHKEHDVIFSQFFGEDALVDERLQGLMRYNKVEPVE